MSPPRVLVAIPAVEWMWMRSAAAIIELAGSLPPGSSLSFQGGSCSLAQKRTWITEEFLRSDFSHLLFIDSDQVPPRDTAQRLLRHDLPIVSALIFQRRPPHRTCAGWHLPEGQHKRLDEIGGPEPLKRVDWCGCGALLIQREALLKIPRPWFRHPENEPGAGEDVHFCLQVAHAGIPIYVDTSLCVGHLGITSIDIDHVMRSQQQAAHLDQSNTAVGEPTLEAVP